MPPGSEPRLRERDTAPPVEHLQAHAQRLGLDPILVRLMHTRGIVDLAAQASFCEPLLGQLRPPEAMAGFSAALELLEHAWRQRWRVGVFGDYDVDGITTATLLATYLEALGLDVVARVADRDRGYGFTPLEADTFAEAKVDLVVMGDVGTSDIEGLERLRHHGISAVVIDHHQVPTTSPPAEAFINPHQVGCGFPFKGLCSAGVAFYLCAALRSRLRRNSPAKFPDPRAWLDLVALATICDMMPLREENRVLAHAGLRHLNARQRPGLRALLEVAGVEADDWVSEVTIGFKLGPRINAPGRLGPAEPALRLLRARTAAEARPLAEHLEMLNVRRRQLSQQTQEEAIARLLADPRTEHRAGLVVANTGWLPGVVGIAAAQIAERFQRPALVLAIDEATGTARGSVRGGWGIDVRAALEACAPLLDRFGGHREAAGVSLPANRVGELVHAFDVAIATQARASASDEEEVDCELPLGSIDPAFCTALARLGPFGMGFAPPRFWVDPVRVEAVRVLKDRHLALTLEQGGARHSAIAFGQASPELRVGDRIGCVFVPSLERFRGVTRLRLQVERWWRRSGQQC